MSTTIKTTTPVKQKAEALAAVTGKKAAAKATAKEAKRRGPVARLTTEWLDSKGKALTIGASARTKDGLIGTVKSRFTMKREAGNVPYVAIAPTGGKGVVMAASGKPRGVHVAAGDVTLVKAAPKK